MRIDWMMERGGAEGLIANEMVAFLEDARHNWITRIEKMAHDPDISEDDRIYLCGQIAKLQRDMSADERVNLINRFVYLQRAIGGQR